MNYELAKRLKEAGFAYDEDVHTTQMGFKGCWLYGPKGVPSDEMVYAPTLSELIEACEGDFFSLNKVPSLGGWLCKGGEKYTAVVAASKEEAVANLWLALKG